MNPKYECIIYFNATTISISCLTPTSTRAMPLRTSPPSTEPTIPGNPFYILSNPFNNNIYDGDGNPTTYNGVPYAYDMEDRLINLPNAFGAVYRDDGLRAWKQVNGTYRFYYLYDGDRVVCEIDNNGAFVNSYGYDAAGLVERYNGTNSYIYTYDPAGNVVQRMSLDNTTNFGIPDFTTFYDAYGSQRGQVNPLTEARFTSPDAVGFGGQWGYYTDNETNSYSGTVPQLRHPFTLNGARYYEPSVGRFLSRDPVGYEGGINLYTFCCNNLVNRADPSGTENDGGAEIPISDNGSSQNSFQLSLKPPHLPKRV